MTKFENIVNPKSIAIVGATSNPDKVGYQILKNMTYAGYKGNIYPINPKYNEILGITTYPDLLSVPEAIDLVVIVVPAAAALEIMNEAAKKKVKAAIIISAGFAEAEEGRQLEQDIIKICLKNDISLLGPNCLGLINTEIKLNATFARDMATAGNVAFLSQSGAMISAIIDWSKSENIGFSKIFSMGNMALIDEADVLENLYQDDQTNVIVGYLERLTPSKKLTEVLTKYSKTKPTIFLFGGQTSYGAQAAMSHTASILSDYKITKEFLEEQGVIIAPDFSHLVSAIKLFSKYQTINGNRFAIITNAGGPGIGISDAMFRLNLVKANIDDQTRTELKNSIGEKIIPGNPIDLIGDASEDDYQKAIKIIANKSNIDGIFVILTPQSTTNIYETAEKIAGLSINKPIIPVFMGGESIQESCNFLNNKELPCFNYYEEAAYAAKELVNFATKSTRKLTVMDFDKLKEYNQDDKYKILKKYNLPIVEYFKVKSEDELKAAARDVGYPVVLKIGDENAHKSDKGGVKLNIQNEDELLQAFQEIGSPAIIGKFIVKEHELFVGANHDHHGDIATVAFGTGGIFAEIINDFSVKIAPFNKETALSLINSTKIGKILNGAREQRVYDLNMLADILVNVSKLITDYKISEIDFNPVLVTKDNFYIADARVIEYSKG